MKLALVVALVVVPAAVVPATGCVTGAGVVKHQDVSLPVLLGATAVDLVITSVAAGQIQEYSYGGSLATGLALTAVDVVIGCLTGACSALRL
jgi:hypothetical protein